MPIELMVGPLNSTIARPSARVLTISADNGKDDVFGGGPGLKITVHVDLQDLRYT